MGLEDFTSDDNTSSGSSSSTTNKVQKPSKENQPSMTNQVFGPENEVAPRDIKFQIKSFNLGWIKQFSQVRTPDGELVMYSSSDHIENDDVSVAVFTSICSFTSSHPYEEKLDILVGLWNHEENIFHDINNNITVEYGDEWRGKLNNAIEDVIEQEIDV